MEFLTCLLAWLIEMIVKIQVITNVDPQKFTTVFISLKQLEAWVSNFTLELMIIWLFSAFDIELVL